MPATIKEKKRGFRTLIKQIIQKRYINDKEYNEIADYYEVSPITRRMEHKLVQITNNIWTGKVENVTKSRQRTWSTDWPIRLQQPEHISHEEMLEMMKNSGVNYVNVWRHLSTNEEERKIVNNIHAQIAETTSLRLATKEARQNK